MGNIKGKQGRVVIFLCSIIVIFEIIIIVYYYYFLEKQLFNERKALFTQFVEKVSENIDSEIRMLWDDTDSLEKLIHTVLIGTFIKKMLILKSLIYLLQNVVH